MSDVTHLGDQMDEIDDELNAFAERIARPLRAPERLESTFDARVMSAIHADLETRSKGRSWWLRPRTVEISPLVGLALAAGVAGIMFFGGAMLRQLGTPQPPVAATVVDSASMV